MAAGGPQDCDRLFEERINAGDLEGLVRLYEPRATFVPQEGEPVTGTAGIRAALAGFVAMKPRLKLDVQKVVTAGEGLAALYSEWSMSAVGPDGATLNLAGKSIEIVRRQPDGAWLFVLDDPFARG